MSVQTLVLQYTYVCPNLKGGRQGNAASETVVWERFAVTEHMLSNLQSTLGLVFNKKISMPCSYSLKRDFITATSLNCITVASPDQTFGLDRPLDSAFRTQTRCACNFRKWKGADAKTSCLQPSITMKTEIAEMTKAVLHYHPVLTNLKSPL
jgi:hypothetical protein